MNPAPASRALGPALLRFCLLALTPAVAGSAPAAGSPTSGATDEVTIAWDELADSFVERNCPEGEPCAFAEALSASHGWIDLGAIRVYCPAERLADRAWLGELAPAFSGLCEMQATFAEWLRPGADVVPALRSDVDELVAWIEKWRPNDFKRLERAESKELVAFLAPSEAVVRAAEHLARAFSRGGELGLALTGAERVELVLAPTRRDFMETVAFLGRDDAKFRDQNWATGVEQWTQVWNGWGLVISTEYAPWTGFDPKFVQKKPIRDIEPDGVAQMIVQQSALALLTVEAGSPEPLFTKRGVANELVLATRGALNLVESERGISTSGARTEPYERFVPGGNPGGGVLPAVPAAPLDMIIENQWRVGHGKDHFTEPLQEGQEAGAKAAKKEKHPRADDHLAHFVLESATQQKHTVSAPFLGPHANAQPYPPFEFLHDYREFFTVYQTAFLFWLRTASDPDPALAVERFGRFLQALSKAPDSTALDTAVSEIYGQPISGADGSTPSLEWQFLAWLAEQ